MNKKMKDIFLNDSNKTNLVYNNYLCITNKLLMKLLTNLLSLSSVGNCL